MKLNNTQKSLRLFALRELSTGRIVPDTFFPDKPSAKRAREVAGANKFCVTYGPDHRHFKATH